MYEKIKMLCKQNSMTIDGLEKELGFARGSLCKLKNHKPTMERVQKIANYFNVSVTELMESEDDGLNTKDRNDIAKDLASIVMKLRSEEAPACFEGGVIPEADQELFAGQLELMLKRLKLINKEKYGKK